MKELRIFFGVIIGLCALIVAAGALYMILGEWHARRQLPPEERTQEVIHKLYDDAVCLECITGGILAFMSLLSALMLSLGWGMIEVINWGTRKFLLKGRVSPSSPHNAGNHTHFR